MKKYKSLIALLVLLITVFVHADGLDCGKDATHECTEDEITQWKQAGQENGKTITGALKSAGEWTSEKFTQMGQSISSAGTSDGAGYGSQLYTVSKKAKGGTSFNACKKIVKEGPVQLNQEPLVTNAKAYISEFESAPETNNELKTALGKLKIRLVKSLECLALSSMLGDAETLESVSEFGISTSNQSMDGQIKCKSEGVTTIDYPACTKAITAYNSFFLGTQAVNSFHQIDLASSNIDAQSSVNADDPTSGLTAQQSSINKQEDQMKEKAMVQGAKMATLMQMIRLIPDKSAVTEKCSSQGVLGYASEGSDSLFSTYNTTASSIVEGFGKDISKKVQVILEKSYGVSIKKIETTNSDRTDNATLQTATVDIAPVINNMYNETDICEEVYGKNNMTPNTKAIDTLKSAVAQAAMEMGKDLMMAHLLGKRSDQIDGLKSKLNNYDPSSAVTFLPAELAKFCQTNPDDPRCLGGGLPQGASQFGTGGMNIQFGEAGGATTFANGDIQEGIASQQATDGSTDPAGLDIAPGFGATATKGGGWSGAGRGPASLKAAGGGSGGGGGGGLPGGVSAPSGGNLAGPSNGQSAYGNYKSSAKKLSYGGGGNKALYGGSRSAARKKPSKSTNPFAKMFGKRKKNGKLNFRNVASKEIPKSGRSLFERISSRYENVNKAKRLVTYEVVK